MLQKEFEERIGRSVTAEAFENIEKIYMNTDLDKDAFCKAWKDNRGLLNEVETKTILVRELYEQRNEMANFLIEQAEQWSVGDLRDKAIAMIGEKEYLRRKIEKGYNLWDADKKLLMEVLRG